MKSFLQDRTAAKTPALRIIATTSGIGGTPESASGSPTHSGHTAHSPHVECIKQGEKVMRLVVTCGCGQRIEIECLYPLGA